jgi:hypothetical protein
MVRGVFVILLAVVITGKKKHVLGQNNLELYLQTIAEVYMTYTIHIFTYMLKIIILLLP